MVLILCTSIVLASKNNFCVIVAQKCEEFVLNLGNIMNIS